MDPVEPKRRGRKLFGTRHKDEAPSEAEMEQEPTPPPSGTEPTPRPPGRSRLGRMYGGTVDPTIVPARPDQLGGKARLTCPSDTAYGDQGNATIPPGATLIFEVELLSIK